MPSTLGTPHLALRPGTPVMSRSPDVLQVGLGSPALQVPDLPPVRRLLELLARPGGASPPEDLAEPAPQVLRRLTEAGLVHPVAPNGRVTDPVDLVLRAQFGADAVRRRARRADQVVAVRADPATELALEPLLERAGLRRTSVADLDATAHLVVTTGQLDREVLDPLVRGSVPHLVVSGAAAGRRVGPFVEPGRTACLRCVDAHESLRDPRLALLIAQAARSAAERPPPVDPVLDQIALAWAVRDLMRYVEGDEPSTWSATVDIDPAGAPALTHWGRHPECGCAWDELTVLA